MPPSDPAALDTERILLSLAEHEVDYVLVGGLAVQTHGHLRTTFDVDIVPRPSRANLERLARALNALEARPLNPGSEGVEISASMLPRATLWQFATAHGPIDVLHDAPGAPRYGELRERALEVELTDLHVAVAGRDDLISMKRARARPVDLEDLAVLTDPELGGSEGKESAS